MPACPTLRVRLKDGQECVINETDFDESVHTVLVERETLPPEPEPYNGDSADDEE